MPLDSYPFSERYGWTTDKYGLSWQVMAAGEREVTQRIIPTLMYAGDRAGRAEEAMKFYASVFSNSRVGEIDRYAKGEEPDREGTVKHGAFTVGGFQLAAMDSARDHNFDFNEAISIMVYCKDQAEIDRYWDPLSGGTRGRAVPLAQGQVRRYLAIVPIAMDEMMSTGTREQIARLTEAFLPMKRFNVAELEKAYEGS